MQSREVQRLRQKLLFLTKNGASWKDAAEQCGVVGKDGKPSKGLAHRIANNDYEPIRPETRQRIGLSPICPVCKHPFAKTKPKRHRGLFDLPRKILIEMLENRQEIK